MLKDFLGVDPERFEVQPMPSPRHWNHLPTTPEYREAIEVTIAKHGHRADAPDKLDWEYQAMRALYTVLEAKKIHPATFIHGQIKKAP